MTPIAYLDFELAITPQADHHYTATILHSEAGNAEELITLPDVALDQVAELYDLPVDKAREIGAALFSALFAGEVRSRYAVSQQLAQQEGKGLRLKLRLTAPELLALPWELLYDPRPAEFVCLTRQTPLVRYLAVPQPLTALAIARPLRILGMVASPQGMAKLDLAGEQARLATALAPLQQHGLVELHWLAGQTWRDLQQALQSGPWHVFHYIGHAQAATIASEGELVLADEAGEIRPLSASELARLLADQPSLRLVVLNACQSASGNEQQPFSSLAARLVQRGLPAVIAMQSAITDEGALEFAQSFYGAVANQWPVDAALSEARKAMSLAQPERTEWATPVLYLRAPDGVLWMSNKPEEETMTEEKRSAVYHINTGGGRVIQGDVNTGGDFIGRDRKSETIYGHKIGGDAVIATVGAGAKNVAVGKTISQQVTEGPAAPTPDDLPLITAALNQVASALTTLALDENRRGRAEQALEDLQTELTKSAPEEEPDGKTIVKMGERLLELAPPLIEALAALFATPAVAKVLGKAGAAALTWVKKRFG